MVELTADADRLFQEMEVRFQDDKTCAPKELFLVYTAELVVVPTATPEEHEGLATLTSGN